MLIRTWGKIERYRGGEAKIEIERNWPELRQDEQNLVLQLAHKEFDDPKVYWLDFLVEFEREELFSMPKKFEPLMQYYL